MLKLWGNNKMSAAKDNEQEMSMEEILASIRKYVTDESGQSSTPAPKATENKKGSVEEPFSLTNELRQSSPFPMGNITPKGVPPFSQSEKTHTIDSTPVILKPVREEEFPHEKDLTDDPKEYAFSYTPPIETVKNEASSMDLNPSLISHAAQEAASSALSKLASLASPKQEAASSLHAQTSLTLDELFKELAHPMIAAWLDKNLPTLVEGLVEKEIKRLTKNL